MVDIKQLEKDIIKYHKKKKKALELMQKEYPSSYVDIAQRHRNPKTGKPITNKYIFMIRRKLIQDGKLEDVKLKPV